MNKLSKLAGCHLPHGTQEAALEAWHMQRNSYWTQHAIETSVWIFCFEDRLSLYSSVWPGTHYVAQAGLAPGEPSRSALQLLWVQA